MGAYVEINAVMFDGVSPAAAGGQGLPLALALEYIDHLPCDRLVIDTDLGQKGGIMPVEGMHRFIRMLMDAGVSYEKIEMMTKITPSQKIMPKATSGVIPMESMELRIATELMPGARQNGRLV